MESNTTTCSKLINSPVNERDFKKSNINTVIPLRLWGFLRGLIVESASAYLNTLMTRHVMRAAVSTQTKITMFFRVGRCVIRDEILDPVSASVTLFPSSSSGRMEEVEFKCVAGEERVCSSPLTRQTAAIMKLRTRLCVDMMVELNTRWIFLQWFLEIKGNVTTAVTL